ncbi:MAG: ribosome-associated translation inhibitor RaiA [Pseudomonadota bacterium]
MNINFTAKNVDMSDELCDLASKKMKKIEKHFSRIDKVHIVFTSENLDKIVETSIHLPGGKECTAKGTAENMYKALDDMIAKLDRQVIKHKEKMADHHVDI